MINEEKIKTFLKMVIPKSFQYSLRDAIPGNIKNIYKSYRERKIKRELPAISKDNIVTDLKQMGIQKGETLMVHSSLKSIGYVEGGPISVIEALKEVLTPSGTLIVPTYSMKEGSMYKTCIDNDYIFDPRTSKSDLGAIPSTFLKLSHVERSIHPTHSVSAWGRHAKLVTDTHHKARSTFGEDSPWDRLMKLDGKLLMIGLGMGRNTLSHSLEDNELDNFPLPVRMKITYYPKCRDWNGEIMEVPVTPLDLKYIPRRIDQPGRQDLRDFFWEEFNRANIINIHTIGRAKSWTASANGYYNHLRTLMEKGITIYSSKKDLENYRQKGVASLRIL